MKLRTVRKFSVCGPCIEQGPLLRQTAKFYVYMDRFSRRERKLAKGSAEYGRLAHIEPCSSCRDHEHTQWPNGYMD
jgi:hypothetical protein